MAVFRFTAKFWFEISVLMDFKQVFYRVDVGWVLDEHHTMGPPPTHEGVAI